MSVSLPSEDKEVTNMTVNNQFVLDYKTCNKSEIKTVGDKLADIKVGKKTWTVVEGRNVNYYVSAEIPTGPAPASAADFLSQFGYSLKRNDSALGYKSAIQSNETSGFMSLVEHASAVNCWFAKSDSNAGSAPDSDKALFESVRNIFVPYRIKTCAGTGKAADMVLTKIYGLTFLILDEATLLLTCSTSLATIFSTSLGFTGTLDSRLAFENKKGLLSSWVPDFDALTNMGEIGKAFSNLPGFLFMLDSRLDKDDKSLVVNNMPKLVMAPNKDLSELFIALSNEFVSKHSIVCNDTSYAEAHAKDACLIDFDTALKTHVEARAPTRKAVSNAELRGHVYLAEDASKLRARRENEKAAWYKRRFEERS